MISNTLRVLALASAAFCFNAVASPPAGAQFISDKLVISIAQLTLPEERPAAEGRQETLDRRSKEVNDWLSSVGGHKWYQTYLSTFGAPTTPEGLQTSSIIGIRDKRLGPYYIHPFPTSVHSMTVSACTASKFDSSSPTLKAQCALMNWTAALTFNDTSALDAFRATARWFLENRVDGKWPWSIDLPSRRLKAPWISGVTQSLAMSVLLREYQRSQNPAYLRAAQRALNWMDAPISEGGLSVAVGQGTWYEEYPDREHPSHVLNGQMWALLGIWDFYRVTGNAKAKRMFDKGVAAIKADISRYDLGYWSVYDQTNRCDMVNGAYQQFIIEQLRVLHAITGEPFLEKYADRWAAGQNSDEGFVHIAAAAYLNEKAKAAPSVSAATPVPKAVNPPRKDSSGR